MACFTVPVAEAIVTTVITKVVEAKEKKAAENMEMTQSMKYDGNEFEAVVTEKKIPFSRKLKWLNYMLWGGALLLIFEHVWHGEVVPWFPFLTNAANPADAAEMMREIGTVGVTMAVAVTAIWGIIVGIVSLIEKRAAKAASPAEAE